MRLHSAQVQNFRSIVDSGVVRIEDRVTVLVGKNEQGKTTFLKGLALFNKYASYAASDFPTHLRPRLEERTSEGIPMVTIWVCPEAHDVEILSKVVPNISEVAQIKIIKFYDGTRKYIAIGDDSVESPIVFPAPDLSPETLKLKQNAHALKARLAPHSVREPAFAPSLPQATSLLDEFVASNFDDPNQHGNLIQTLVTSLNTVPGQDAAIQQDIAAFAKELNVGSQRIQAILQTDQSKTFEQQLPHFVYHSTTLDKIPNDVSIVDFVKNPEATSRGMANLCGVAGLSVQKIQNLATTDDNAMKETFEDHYRSQVSGGINEFWTQETYTVHFRFDQGKMSVSISDGTYERRIAPMDRSEGFQWYLSFFSALLSEVAASPSIIFLLDNPALELHADGQRDIKRFLEEKLPASAQIIYVTHSPAMIDPFHLEQLRQVILTADDQGTKVKALDFKEGQDFDLLEPVRSAVGASIASSLICNEYNVLVEGAADKPILEGAIVLAKSVLRILVNGSVAESKDGFLVRFYQRAKLPFVVVLDADSAGRDVAQRLRNWGVPGANVLDLAVLFQDRGGDDFEIEDLLGVEFYEEAVREAYPDRDVESIPTDWPKKRTKYYEEVFKSKFNVGFNKRRVADKVKARLIAGKADRETSENLETVVRKIEEQLTGLVR